MKKIVTILIMLLVFAFTFVACTSKTTPANTPATSTPDAKTSSASPTTKDDGVMTIVFSVKTPSNDTFQSSLAASIQNAVEKEGGQFILMGAGSASNVATQVTQLEDVINKGCDGLIVNPLDSNAVLPALRSAKEKGIPVVIVDTPLPKGNEDLYIAFVGTDNYKAGFLAGKAMIEKLGNKGKVALVRGANGNAAGDERANGFKDAIKDSQLELVGEQVGNWSNYEAMQVTENMLQANPDIAGLFSCSDVMVEGILQAYKDNGKTNIVTISVDGTAKAVNWIANGEIYATMAQFPSVMGTKAVELIVKAIRGEDMSAVDKVIDSGVELITKDNCEEYRPKAF